MRGYLPCPCKIFGDLEDSSSDVFRFVYRRSAKRMETANVSIGPNVYYAGKPNTRSLRSQALLRFLLVRSRPVRVWSSLLNKVVFLAVGATFLGQAVAFFHQLSTGEKQFDE